MYYCYVETPIGELLLAGDADGLSMVGFPKGSMRREPEPDWIFNEKPLAEACQQLREYFAGERREFDLPLQLSGTEFQVSVLEALQDIPYGETTSYGEIARRIGRPRAVRAEARLPRSRGGPGEPGRRGPAVGFATEGLVR